MSLRRVALSTRRATVFPLTKVPTVVSYGDNIPTEPTDVAGQDNWRVRLAMARLWWTP